MEIPLRVPVIPQYKGVVVAGLAIILLPPVAPFGSRGVFALDAGKAITQYSHDVWGVEDGLPQSWVQAIVQTREATSGSADERNRAL